MIVLDASLLIAQLDARDVHAERARSFLRETGRSALVASTVTLAEVLVRHVSEGLLDQGEATLRRIGVDEVPVAPGAFRRLASLRATTGLKLPDCCVLLAAQDARADAIATFDDRLADAARGLGLSVASA